MSLQNFVNEAISPWMKQEGPDSDIVMSSRIRLARNFSQYPFPIIGSEESLEEVLEFFQKEFQEESFRDYEDFEMVRMTDLQPVEKECWLKNT